MRLTDGVSSHSRPSTNVPLATTMCAHVGAWFASRCRRARHRWPFRRSCQFIVTANPKADSPGDNLRFSLNQCQAITGETLISIANTLSQHRRNQCHGHVILEVNLSARFSGIQLTICLAEHMNPEWENCALTTTLSQSAQK